MENVIYEKCIVPSRESADGETATILYVTEENNGHGVFTNGYDGPILLKWFFRYQRNEAIEHGVTLAEELLIERAQKKAA